MDAARDRGLLPSADYPIAGAGAVIDLTPFMGIGLLLVRPGTLIMTAPGFGGAYAPSQVKVGLILLLALVLLPTTTMPPVGSPVGLALIVAREMAIGLALGMS